MKKILLLVILLLVLKPVCLHSQSVDMAPGISFRTNDFWYNYTMGAEERNKKTNQEAHLKAKEVIGAEMGPRHVKYFYDTTGRVVSYSSGKNYGVMTAYNEDGQKLRIECYRKGKLIEKDTFVWEGKNLKEVCRFGEDDKPLQRQYYTYDSSHVTSCTSDKYTHKQFREQRRTVYEYYPDYTYKRITYYKKGKPSYFTVFDCNPVGQDHKVKKDSAYNCIKYDLDSLGNKIRISLNTDRNFSWKHVEYFNKEDQLVARKTYDLKKKGILVWSYYFLPGKELVDKFISYKNSKEYYRIENRYDNKDKCIASLRYRRGKIKSSNKNEFNEKGLLTKAEWSGKHEKKKRQTTYLYEYY